MSIMGLIKRDTRGFDYSLYNPKNMDYRSSDCRVAERVYGAEVYQAWGPWLCTI